MKTVLVSGCFDILHGGHIQFLRDARALGDRLVVSVADASSLAQHKGRLPAMPTEHKAAVLGSMACVDRVVYGDAGTKGLDFLTTFEELQPDILAVAGDDEYAAEKCDLVRDTDCQYVVLRKWLDYAPVSTTEIRRRCAAPGWVPLRVDFAGGWLDVPSLARPGSMIVNCAVTPGISLAENWLSAGAGMGGSAAWAALNGKDALQTELDAGVGWQDPAVILETGLCVWESGPRPRLVFRSDGAWLKGKMAIRWTGTPHTTADIVDKPRDYEAIGLAGLTANEAVVSGSLSILAHAMEYSYLAQRAEGMDALVARQDSARKYCGAGWGGYALYLFREQTDRDRFVEGDDDALAVEPFDRWSGP